MSQFDQSQLDQLEAQVDRYHERAGQLPNRRSLINGIWHVKITAASKRMLLGLRVRADLLCAVFCLVVALAMVGDVLGDQFRTGVSHRNSIETLETRIAVIESAPDIDSEARSSLLELYRRALGNLQIYHANLQAINGFEASIEAAIAEVASLRAEARNLTERKGEPVVDLDTPHTRGAIGHAIFRLGALESAHEAKLSRLQADRRSEQRRSLIARQLLAEALSRQAKLAGDEEAISLIDEVLSLKRARQWLRDTQSLVTNSEIILLDQELMTLGPRMMLLRERRYLARLELEQVRRQFKEVESLWISVHTADAKRMIEQSVAQQQGLVDQHPLLLSVASNNVKISERILEAVEHTAAAFSRVVEANQRAARLEREYRNLRQKLEFAGVDAGLGEVLQAKQEDLPSLSRLEDDIAANAATMSTLSLQLLNFDEHLWELLDQDAFIDELLRTSPLARRDKALDSKALREALRPLLLHRSQAYRMLVHEETERLSVLVDMEYMQRRLQNITQQFKKVIAERSLWVRSEVDSGLDVGDLEVGDHRAYLSLREMRQVLVSIVTLDSLTLLLIVGVLAAIIIRVRRPSLLSHLSSLNSMVGDPAHDRFLVSVKALAITILLAAPGPLVFGVLGWKLYPYSYDSGLAKALGPGCRWVAFSWYLIALFYQLCRPGGLAQCHFQWVAPVLVALRRKSRVLMMTFVPMGFINECLVTMDSTGLQGELIRLCLMLETLIVAIFFYFVLRYRGAMIQALLRSKPDVLLIRYRYAWIFLLVINPIVLVALTGLGYAYTASTLLNNYLNTIGLLVIVVIIHQMAMRWLHVTYSALSYRERTEQANTASRADISDMPGNLLLRRLRSARVSDLDNLEKDSQRLLNTLIGLAMTIGLLLVWQDTLPALVYLDKLQLWNTATLVDGVTVMKPVTLADLFVCVVITLSVVFLYRTLPSLMKLMFLQALPLSESARYTTISLTLYILILVGIFSVANILGFSWSKFQWLAAALGVGIGFGLQEIVANFISGLILLLERPIRVGDLVTVGEVEGFVSRIRIRATTILTYDRQELLVPNKDFITGNLLNWSLSDPISRLIIDVGVDYDTDVAHASRIIADVAADDKQVIAAPAPMVIFESFGDSVLNLRLQCFIDDIEERIPTRSRLHYQINKRFREEGIKIAFPQMDVHLDPSPVT